MNESPMPRILFLDNDPEYLDHAEEMLTSMRKNWEMTFVTSAADAGQFLDADDPCDLVIANLEMGGTDGIDFFVNLREKHPEIVRFVLLEPEGHPQIMQASYLVQQIIQKPSDNHELSVLMNRAMVVRTRFWESPLRQRLHQLGGLPSLPAIYKEMLTEMNSEKPSIARIAEIISRDMSMSAKVLQVVNSAGVGLHHSVSDVTHAASLLGLDKISMLVLMAETFSSVAQERLPQGFSLDALWSHSLRVGEYAKKIMESVAADDEQLIDQSFAAGLLHDIGVIILAAHFPDELTEAIETAQENDITLFEAEKSSFESTHADVGGYMIELWGLPDAITEAIAYHDLPSSFPEPEYPSMLPEHQFTPLVAVHVANAMCEHERREAYGCIEGEIDNVFLERLGFLENLEGWWELCE